MSKGTKLLLIAAALFAAALIALVLGGPLVQQRLFYPKPGVLPPLARATTAELLARLQQTLETNAPGLTRQLQPGLTAAEISSLESAGGFKLPEDIRAFYRWHNGQASGSPDGLLPGQRFLPLEVVVRERALLHQQVAAAGFLQLISFRVFAGHRASWIQIFDDGSSDGYFVDPGRPDAEGAFFYNFAEARSYTWFPSFRNFLTGLIECYETGAVRVSPDGLSLQEDLPKVRLIWQRLAGSSEI